MTEWASLKRILHFAPSRAHLDSLFEVIGSLPASVVHKSGRPPAFTFEDVWSYVEHEQDACRAAERLRDERFDLLIVDLREFADTSGTLDRHAKAAECLFEAILAEDDIELRFGFHRVLALVAGPDCDRVDRLIASLGGHGLARIIRDPTACLGADAPERPERLAAFAELTVREAQRLMDRARQGSRALCTAGGGLTGLYFEMGALKCLNDCLGAEAINSFDMYFGISAGAVVSGFLANGFTVDECMAAVDGVGGGRIPPVNLNLFRLRHLNGVDLARRVMRGMREVAGELKNVARGEHHLSLASAILDYGDFIGAPFHGERYEAVLEEIFSSKGISNDFRRLPVKTFIGATDQDARTHVLFGGEGFEHVPLSKAIQASMSFHPAFASTRVDGRYYEDGAVTRTSNFTEAIHRGSDLVFIIDPFVPYVSKTPGYARSKGILYNIDQDIRTITYTRFEKLRRLALQQHPHVSTWTFLPNNTLRRLMSVNPMDHRPYQAIWRGAYLSTLKRLQRVRHRLIENLAAHDLTLNTEKAEAVAARLRSTHRPKFADFFPNGKVELQTSTVAEPRPTKLPQRHAQTGS